jgi:hypothetical protein
VLKADLDVDLPRDCQGILDFNAKLADGALQLGVAKQELNRADVAGAAVGQCRLGAAQRMCSVTNLAQLTQPSYRPVGHIAGSKCFS